MSVRAAKILLWCALILFSLPFGCNTQAQLRVGTLPVVDSLPLRLAQYKPIFAENDLIVEGVYFKNSSDLRNALIDGKVDAGITDLVGALLLNNEQERVTVVRVALGQTVVVFNQQMVNAKPAIVRRFLRAYEQSVRELNVRHDQYRFLVKELVRASAGGAANLSIPIFPFPGEVPTESDVESANTWLLGKKMIPQPVPYRQAVNAGFLWDPYQFKPAACCGW